MGRWRAVVAAALCGAEWSLPVAAGPGILERLIAPTAPEEFLASVYEQRWEYFPHNESLLPITLAQVSEWIAAMGDGESVVETLPHPVTKRRYKPEKTAGGGQGPLDRVHDAFLQGFSMVINSLHRWSEPGLRLAQELYAAVDLPVDVYMYLTPPHSMSYGLHNDVMDAWMVQLQGSKTWKICGRNPAPWNPQIREQELTGTCPEVTMRGGDVLYLPFHTLHQAKTGDELSMHLTVNVERQYYVWATLLIAVLHKVVDSSLTVEKFVGSDLFQMEGESELEVFLQRLAQSEPRLLRLPAAGGGAAGASRRLVRPLCGADLPDGHLEAVVAEFRSVVATVATEVSGRKQLGRAKVRVAGTELTGGDVAGLLSEERAAEAVPWALELARLHAVMHFGRDSPQRFLPRPELFSSLAAARADRERAAEADQGITVRGLGKALAPGARLQRHRDVRAVLLLEDRRSPGAKAALRVNSQSLQVSGPQVPLVQFCLGLFGPGSARGRPFRAADVPGGLAAARPTLQRLLSAGALAVLPPGPGEEGLE